MFKPPFYPTPPPKGASRLDQLRFLRKNYLYGAALVLPMFVSGLVFSQSLLIVVCLICWAVQSIGAGTLERQIRAARRNASS